METSYAVQHEVSRDGSNAVTQAEAKNYCKQDLSVSAEDDLFDDIIDRSVAMAEKVTNQQMNTSEVITSTFDVEEPNSDGHYVLELLYRTSAISGFTVTSAIDNEGDSVTIDSDDYELRGNKVIFREFRLEGYRVVLEYTATVTAAELAKFKAPLLEVVAEAYVNRNEGNTMLIAVSSFDPFIDYTSYL